MEYMTYHYLAIIPGFVLALLIVAPYTAFVGQHPAPRILYLPIIIALILPTIITLRLYRNESAAIKRTGKKILDAAEGVPFPSLLIVLSPAGLLFVIMLICWIAASSPI